MRSFFSRRLRIPPLTIKTLTDVFCFFFRFSSGLLCQQWKTFADRNFTPQLFPDPRASQRSFLLEIRYSLSASQKNRVFGRFRMHAQTATKGLFFFRCIKFNWWFSKYFKWRTCAPFDMWSKRLSGGRMCIIVIEVYNLQISLSTTTYVICYQKCNFNALFYEKEKRNTIIVYILRTLYRVSHYDPIMLWYKVVYKWYKFEFIFLFNF